MNHERRAESLYPAALRIFAEYGFRKATLEDIAAELGLVKSSLYAYAKDKRDLYRATVAWGFGRWQEKVARAVAAESGPVEKLYALTRGAYRYLDEDPALRRVLERDPELLPLFDADDPFAAINRESVRMIREILDSGCAAGAFFLADTAMAARSMFSIYVMFIQKTYVAREGEDIGAMFETTIELFIRGLAARPSAS